MTFRELFESGLSVEGIKAAMTPSQKMAYRIEAEMQRTFNSWSWPFELRDRIAGMIERGASIDELNRVITDAT